MAVEGIGNLVQNVADRLFEQKHEKQAVANTFILGRGNTGNGAVAEDRFTPSAQNEFAQTTAQDAGIFQVGQGVQTEITANIRFDQAPETRTRMKPPHRPQLQQRRTQGPRKPMRERIPAHL